MTKYTLLLIFLPQLCTGAIAFNQPSTTAVSQKGSDILRQLLNQETLIRMSLTKDVQSLLKDQRKNLVRDKDITDVGTEVDRLTRETTSLKELNIKLTNDVNALLEDKQEAEEMDQIRANKTKNMEKKIEELTQQTSVLDQRNLNLTQEIVAVNKKDLSSQITGLENELLGYPDIAVQAACVGTAVEGFVSAIRRPCSNEAPSCDVICKDATPQMKAKIGNQGRKEATCMQTYHFYGANQRLKPGIPKQVNRIMYRYSREACSKQFCGPNFCCCYL
ncbi:uncharacterized protein LOC125650876 [Ostrea edulis]|uniref:uncharacterized protein LOC125650876 n=1 Tax=Ostrea edulis TaxID=37623 RepID=UPI0020943708|nr:uncharacterized protein LOC125650876 [Ostrea edulis]